jgi:pimeloyl-ACP methyl ester carboxylesterase
MAQLEEFTLYAVDRPGFGLTDTAPHTTENLRSLAVGFLEQVLDGLGLDRPVFVASSMGALWTTWLALDRPQRVAAMTHIGCPALILGTSAPVPMRFMAIPPLGRLMMRLQPPSPKQVDQMFAMMKEDLSAWPELRDLMVAFERLPANAPTWLELLHSVLRLRGARPQVALTAEELAHITQPVQLIWGEEDPFGSPAVGERVATIVEDAELHVLPGGHVPWLSQADRVGHLAAPFLRKHSGK